MAFVNEKLTQEEKEMFIKKGIKNPLDYMNNSILIPNYWTIDRDKQAYLFQIGVQRDWPDEVVFMYQLREVCLIISVKRKTAQENTVIYSIQNTCYTPFDEIKDSKLVEELKDVLKLALEQFKIDGTPDYFNMAVNVVCDF